MEKTEIVKMTEQRKKYQEITGNNGIAIAGDYVAHTQEYVAWLEAKAYSYDRIINGGKKTLTNKKSFSSDEFLEEVKKFLIGYGFYLTDMEMTVTPKPTESEYGFMKYAIGKRQIVITGEVDWIDKEMINETFCIS